MRQFILAFALLAAACGPQPAATTSSTQSSMSDMPTTTTTSAAAGPVMGSGTVAAVDGAAHTVTISHGPIDAISWPAMTMKFTTENPALLTGVAVGDHVSFQLKSAQEPGVVVALTKE